MTPKVWRLLAVSCTSVILVFVVCFMGPRFLAESGGVFGQKEVVVRASPRAPPKPQNRLLPDAEEIDRWIKLRDMGSSAAEEEAKEKEALKQAVLQKEKQRAARGEVLIYFGGGCFWHMQHAFVQVTNARLSCDSSSRGGTPPGWGACTCRVSDLNGGTASGHEIGLTNFPPPGPRRRGSTSHERTTSSQGQQRPAHDFSRVSGCRPTQCRVGQRVQVSAPRLSGRMVHNATKFT
jgi:hypothetical protein